MTKTKPIPSESQAIVVLLDGADLRVLPFPRMPQYLVCEDGRIMNVRRDGWLRPCVLKRGGYLAVSLWVGNKGKTWQIQRIIAITFHGEPPTPKHDAAHGDGDRKNNWSWNISWKTRRENEADKERHGTRIRGETHHSAKLSDSQVEQIRARALVGKRGIVRQLAKEFEVSSSQISNIIKGYRRHRDTSDQ